MSTFIRYNVYPSTLPKSVRQLAEVWKEAGFDCYIKYDPDEDSHTAVRGDAFGQLVTTSVVIGEFDVSQLSVQKAVEFHPMPENDNWVPKIPSVKHHCKYSLFNERWRVACALILVAIMLILSFMRY